MLRDQAVLLGSLAHLRLLEGGGRILLAAVFGGGGEGNVVGGNYFLVPARPIVIVVYGPCEEEVYQSA